MRYLSSNNPKFRTLRCYGKICFCDTEDGDWGCGAVGGEEDRCDEVSGGESVGGGF